jgi:hypothetical protein
VGRLHWSIVNDILHQLARTEDWAAETTHVDVDSLSPDGTPPGPGVPALVIRQLAHVRLGHDYS